MNDGTTSRPLRVVTLCSGYDSQLLALRRLSRDFPGFGWECVGWSEVDRFACRAHDALFPELAGLNLGDMTRIDWEAVPDFDLLTYSTPCTDISDAGARRGLDEGSGTRSSILWNVRDAVRVKRPRWLLMENVAALVHARFRHQFLKWRLELEGLGYESHARVLDARDYGVPQHRERVFMVSALGGGAFRFPAPLPLTRCLADVMDADAEAKYWLPDGKVDAFVRGIVAGRPGRTGFAFRKGGDGDA